MKKKNSLKIISIISTIALMLLISCTPDTTPSLYSDKDGGVTPVITSIEPAQGLAGVTKITITGENFSSDAAKNFVHFVPLKATILSSSENELIVLAPDLVKDSIEVKIDAGVEKFSDPVLYKLDAAVEEVFPFLGFQQPYAVTTDEFGNIYISLTEDGGGKGIKKITPDGEIFDFAPKGGETFFWSMKYQTGGTLYGVRGVRALFEITEGNASAIFAVFDNGTSMSDLDFDKYQNIWTAGKGGKIYRVTPEKDIKSFDFADDVTAVRIFNDYLYLAAKSDGIQNIIRMPIVSPDSLGVAEVYFQFSANVESGTEVKSFTFSALGQMFIATAGIAGSVDPMNPIMYVNSDGTFGTWYPDLIGSFASTITWGTGVNAYMIRDKFVKVVGGEDVTVFSQLVLRLNMEQIGAPEYGRD